MKIKLIAPKSSKRPMDTELKTRMSPPLGLLILAALSPEDVEISISDENIEKMDFTDNPDLLGITVKVDTFPRAAEISAVYRKKGIPVVFGGPHVTAAPELCQAFADTLVIGEAEEIWPRLIKDFKNGKLKSIYQNKKSINMENIPVPKWGKLKSSAYLFNNTIRISRGCPFKCGFCYNSASNIDSSYRLKSIPAILKEIESLKCDHIMFIDDNFIGNPAFAEKLCDELACRGLSWQSAVSADIGNHPKLIRKMAQSGCKSLFIGFESIQQENLLQCKKKQNKVDYYDKTIALIHEQEMMVNASMVFGFDTDTAEIFEESLNWLIKNKVDSMTAHILTPYPGTPFYNQLKKDGRIIESDLALYNTANVVFQPKKISREKLYQNYLKIYKDFYSWKNIIKRMPGPGPRQRPFLEFNLFYRKYGWITEKIAGLIGYRRFACFARKRAFSRNKADKSSQKKEAYSTQTGLDQAI